ncbi:hypothetical protein [Xanthomonas arboricola]|uniref:hypothetical protein n=1 Tax=Xanthomonas arboricola TaxID=56448 RepID=UPI000CB2C5F5|nr:hypothetical protein [Xanthomonas arboricola]SOT98056.1 hypothetical protein CFBP6762_01699 [Xanthomonas arboricola pv. fragariae]
MFPPHWYAQLIPMLPFGPAQRNSSLPVYDLTSKKAAFSSKAHIRPLSGGTDHLKFSMWNLAHAIKKAECTNSLATSVANTMALGFLLENQHLFDYSGKQFNLADGAASYLDDFSQTGITGRVAQGFALLQMECQGYGFVSRFDTFRKKLGVPIPTVASGGKHKSGKPIVKSVKTPDFVVEKFDKQRALVESKGSFLDRGRRADIKGSIAHALAQLSPWGSQFSPAITKKFAIGTYLREPEINDKEPSLMIVVDPEGEQSRDAVPVPHDAVRRLNYASWLHAMGYGAVSNKLISPLLASPMTAAFEVAEFSGGQYAYVPIAWASANDPDGVLRVTPIPSQWPALLSFSDFPNADIQILVLALDFEILKKVAFASRFPSRDVLSEEIAGPGQSARPLLQDSNEGSRFLDGSFIGLVRPQRSKFSTNTREELVF